MDVKSTDVAIVGGGQAGLALSYRLTELGRPHVILEQHRLVESWRSKRWDSLRLIAPNWSMVMPGWAYPGDEPDGFMGRDEVVQYLAAYARSFGAPAVEGVRVTGVQHDPVTERFTVVSDDGTVEADHVVLATGALQQPNLPAQAAELPARIAQHVAAEYRKPDLLAPGGVLVVGSGETGVQIAEELARSGREVYLSGGRSWWAPRRYRGRDIAAWFRVTGWLDRLAADLPPGVHTGQPNPQLTGAGGGHDISPHSLARDGVRLLGRLRGINDGTAFFTDDLAANVAWADAQARAYIETIDRIIDAEGLDVSAKDVPADLEAEPSVFTAPAELELRKAGVRTVIWATGYRPDFGWVGLPFLDADGHPIQRRGVTPIKGLYILGLDWLHNAKSGLFAGMGDDATYLAEYIVGQRPSPILDGRADIAQR